MTTRVRVGFAGCGEVCAEKHLPALREVEEIEVVAVADANPARVEYVEERFAIPHCYYDVASLLAEGGLDAVALCLPPGRQIDAAIAALDAGLHVWIDPPTGLTLADCDRLMAHAANSDRSVIVGFHMRWHRLVAQARELVRSGQLGTVRTLRGIWSSPRQADRIRGWRRYRAEGGGALGEPAIDHFDLWRHILGSEIATISAYSVDDEWEDASAVIAGRMENGVLVSATFSERASHDVELEICGDAGRLRVSLVRFEGLEHFPAGTMASDPRHRLKRFGHFVAELPRALPRMHKSGDYRTSYRDQWRHFADCVAHGVPVQSTLEDGRRATAAMVAAMVAARSGEVVRCAPVLSERPEMKFSVGERRDTQQKQHYGDDERVGDGKSRLRVDEPFLRQ
ncbi:MAG TPA: Gfo/Idh/MocA family oxidoreductase [Gemmatimonadaceae bacterium]